MILISKDFISNLQDLPYFIFKNNESKWCIEISIENSIARLFTADETLPEEQQKEQVEIVFEKIKKAIIDEEQIINMENFNE